MINRTILQVEYEHEVQACYFCGLLKVEEDEGDPIYYAFKSATGKQAKDISRYSVLPISAKKYFFMLTSEMALTANVLSRLLTSGVPFQYSEKGDN